MLARALGCQAQLAYDHLDRLFNEEREYFCEKTGVIISGLDLPPDKAGMPRDFAEKAFQCLDEAARATG